MSSWIPSLFNPFADDDDADDPSSSSVDQTAPKISPTKEDLSAVFRGVAAFLAPPQTTSSSEAITGIKNDLAEIQGSLKSGLSLISSRFTSNLLQFQSQLNNDEVDEEEDEEGEDEEEEEKGFDEEVVDFVSKISGRPELWTDFPLPLGDDFDLSDYQREHAANIDHLVPDFVMLRQKLCSQISVGKFWLIYFILLLPRLNEEDQKLLSTPEVIEARETLLKKLQSKSGAAQVTSENPEFSGAKKEKESSEITKDSSAEPVNASKTIEIGIETEFGQLSKEVDTGSSSDDHNQSGKEVEDVSFSDLEDNDEDDNNAILYNMPKVSRDQKSWQGQGEKLVTLNKSSEAVDGKQNKESESEESNDWLTVDDTDFDSLATS